MIFKGAVVSVGGTPEALIATLDHSKPPYVLFIVSTGSRHQVEENILPRLSYTPQFNLAVLPSEADLASCYEQIKIRIPEWLLERGLSPGEVYVDYTGGTKPMSAGLTLAGVESFSHFHYVGGLERDKDNLGVVRSGTEQVLKTVNPWGTLAIVERQRSDLLFSNGNAEQAAEVMRRAAGKCGKKLQRRLTVLADVADLCARADLFMFRGLAHEFQRIASQVEIIFAADGRMDDYEPLVELTKHWDRVDKERRDTETPGAGHPYRATFLELLANALRRSDAKRYDDAAARLYRATELFLHGKLRQAFGGKLGRLFLTDVPEEAREAFRREFGEGPYLFGIKEAFVALGFSLRPEDRELSARYGEIKNYLQMRNDSILAHGLRPVDLTELTAFFNKLLEFTETKDEEILRWPKLVF